MKQEEIKKLIEHNYNTKGDIHSTIEYAKSFYPERIKSPIKPNIFFPHTAQQALEYSSKLKAYEDEYQVWKENKANSQSEINMINAEIEQFIKTEAGLYNIPKQYQNKVYNLAWEDGHSYGHYEVYNKLCKLVDIF